MKYDIEKKTKKRMRENQVGYQERNNFTFRKDAMQDRIQETWL